MRIKNDNPRISMEGCLLTKAPTGTANCIMTNTEMTTAVIISIKCAFHAVGHTHGRQDTVEREDQVNHDDLQKNALERFCSRFFYFFFFLAFFIHFFVNFFGAFINQEQTSQE